MFYTIVNYVSAYKYIVLFLSHQAVPSGQQKFYNITCLG